MIAKLFASIAVGSQATPVPSISTQDVHEAAMKTVEALLWLPCVAADYLCQIGVFH